MGRQLEQAVDAVLGRSSLRFSFEITPISVAGLQSGVTAVSVLWEKGSMVSYTDLANVDAQSNTAEFAQVMRQTATLYKQGNALLPKYYTFKVQSVKTQSAPSSCSSTASTPSPFDALAFSPRRKTVARAKVDLAQFCSAQSNPSPRTQLCVPLEPHGTMFLDIRTVWLQHHDSQGLQRGLGSSAGRSCGSTSDVDTTTDRSSVASSLHSSHHSNTDTLSGSAELDQLLQEAEAATAAKTHAPGSHDTTKTLTLASLRKLPRGPSGPSSRSHLSATTGSLGAQSVPAVSPQQQWQKKCEQLRAVLDKHGGEASSRRSSSGSCSTGSAGGWPAGGTTGRRHRRTSSVPITPPIAEADSEGPDTASITAQQAQGTSSGLQAASPAAAADQTLQQHQGQLDANGCNQSPQHLGADPTAPWPFDLNPASVTSNADDDQEGLEEADDPAVWMDACSSSTAPGAFAAASGMCKPSSGPEGLRSLSGRMPTWLWPSSRLAVRDLTTDDIMRRISNSRDPAQLQQMARGLLCERNEWRFRATQAERANTSLVEELEQLRAAQTAIQPTQTLHRQQSEGQLLHNLVDAKVQLAQADLTMQDLKCQLALERKRHMQALAKLTNLQTNFDQYVHEQHIANKGAAKPVVCYV